MFITFGFTGAFYIRAQILFNLTLMSSFDLIIVQPIHNSGQPRGKENIHWTNNRLINTIGHELVSFRCIDG
jgi:hypothetical protein